VLPGLRVLVPALLLAVSACAKSGDGEVEPNNSPVAVEVSNDFALPMGIYVIGSGITHRLGTVDPGMNAHFTLPQNLVGGRSVRFEARPTKEGRPFQSDDILLAPGTIVDFAIAAQLFNSTITLR